MSIVLYRVFGSDYRQDHRLHVLSAAIQIQKTGQDHHFFPHMVAVGSHPVQKQGKGFLAHALLPRQAAVIHDAFAQIHPVDMGAVICSKPPLLRSRDE